VLILKNDFYSFTFTLSLDPAIETTDKLRPNQADSSMGHHGWQIEACPELSGKTLPFRPQEAQPAHDG
jgi:hypothetical protein